MGSRNLQEKLEKLISREIFGKALIYLFSATPGNPMALVMDYLPHGPLNRFLQSHKDSVEKEDLLEAAVSLARALLHLEELNVVHGNIRLRNVLVAHYGEEGLKVKLADPGQNFIFIIRQIIDCKGLEFYIGLSTNNRFTSLSPKTRIEPCFLFI